MYYIIGLPFAN